MMCVPRLFAKEVTWFTKAWNDDIDPFLHTITCLTYDGSPESAEELEGMFQVLMLADTVLWDFVADTHNALPQELDHEEMMEYLSSSTTFRPLLIGKSGSPDVYRMDWNVYVISPTSDLKLNLRFREILSTYEIETTLFGTGKAVQDGTSCVICTGAGHSQGLCPFPQLDGWMGPVPPPLHQTPPQATASTSTITVAGAVPRRPQPAPRPSPAPVRRARMRRG
ncbi:hypothetical protein EXIGLDRAFT_435682 [Exidia glandulosa HHB12029]|uniref:Uncharacterized protein n=1 Tax=Exidia glandulosa HHB12029 TaxID=1314781 RepID=A0A165KG65_EXIGL|nr:hypothetical protein EXIGLDRAFT_435682 [Exidia glandulosa HHB12029]